MAKDETECRFSEQIKQQMQQSGLSARAAALAAGLPIRSVQGVLEGHSPSLGRAAEIGRALGLEVYIGPPRGAVPGESPPAPPEGPSVASAERIPKAITDTLGLPQGASADAVVRAMEAKLASRGTAHATPVAALERTLKSEARSLKNELAALLDARLPPAPVARLASEDPLEPDTETGDDPHLSRERIFLPCGADVRAAAGTGSEVFEETEITIGIPADTFPMGRKPRSAIALRADGDSMEPIIHSGDFLAIDRDDREPRSGKIYVLRTDTGLVVKRLRQEAGGWIMTSDNGADYPPRPVGQEDRILGRVIWFGPEKAVVMAGG